MNLSFPYGKTKIDYKIQDDRICGVLRSRLDEYDPGKTQQQLVQEAMEHPIASLSLYELAKGKKKVVLIASDHTRPVPSKLIVPLMLKEIRRASPDADITILIATGCHRATRTEELAEKFGPDIMGREKIVIHDCEDKSNMVEIDTLPSGGKLQLNRLAVEADLLVSEGFIEPHFFAGFSGGRKSVLPGIASRMCVHYNHNSGFMDDPNSRTGVLDGNLIHRDMLYAAKKVGLAYIVNTVLNSHNKVIACFAGDYEKAHRAGAEFVSEKSACDAVMSDVVVTTNNGYPLDQNIYQMVKGISAAETTCRDGGVIIALGKCRDGVGGDGFLEMFRSCTSIEDLLRQFRATPPEKTKVDQWQAHILARVLEKHTVILVSDADDETVRQLHMIPAHTLQEAMVMAEEILGNEHCSVVAIPEGISVIIHK